MTMEAFAQSLHSMYSIPVKGQPATTTLESSLYGSSPAMASQYIEASEGFYRDGYLAYGDQTRESDLYIHQQLELPTRQDIRNLGYAAYTDPRLLLQGTQPAQIDEREATAEYYRKLRELLLPKDGEILGLEKAYGKETNSESLDMKGSTGNKRSASRSPTRSYSRDALSSIADYRSRSKSPVLRRTAEVHRRSKSRSRSRSRTRRRHRRKEKRRRRSYSSDSSNSSSRTRSRSRCRKRSRSRSYSRHRRRSRSTERRHRSDKYRSRSSSRSRSRSSEIRRKRTYSRRNRTYSRSGSRESAERCRKHRKRSTSPEQGKAVIDRKLSDRY